MYLLALLNEGGGVKWTDVGVLIASVGAIVVSIGNAIYSYAWQKRLEDRKLKQELFHLRYELYREILEASGYPVNSLVRGETKLSIYGRCLEKAQFLFSEQVVNALQAFTEQDYRVWRYVDLEVAEQERSQLSEEAMKLLEEKTLHVVNLMTVVKEELTLVEKDVYWWSKLCAWVDRSEVLSSEDAKKRMGLS